jgi:hypothetical protein
MPPKAKKESKTPDKKDAGKADKKDAGKGDKKDAKKGHDKNDDLQKSKRRVNQRYSIAGFRASRGL